MIKFNFVCLSDALKTKQFLDRVPRSVECINYMSIASKLAKNDYANAEPSDEVISSFLNKSLQAALTAPGTQELYYVVSTTSDGVLESVMSLVDMIVPDSEVEYVLHCSPEHQSNNSSLKETQVYEEA